MGFGGELFVCSTPAPHLRVWKLCLPLTRMSGLSANFLHYSCSQFPSCLRTKCCPVSTYGYPVIKASDDVSPLSNELDHVREKLHRTFAECYTETRYDSKAKKSAEPPRRMSQPQNMEDIRLPRTSKTASLARQSDKFYNHNFPEFLWFRLLLTLVVVSTSGVIVYVLTDTSVQINRNITVYVAALWKWALCDFALLELYTSLCCLLEKYRGRGSIRDSSRQGRLSLIATWCWAVCVLGGSVGFVFG